MKNYVITGATGHIGNVIAKELLKKGNKVRVIGRSAEKLKELQTLGAEPSVGDIMDSAFVTRAFTGADAVFCVNTPNLLSDNVRKEQNTISDHFYNAVKTNHVKNVVLLSSIGADLRNGAGIVDGLGYMEDLFLHLTDVNVLNLRPTYFMENTFGLIPTIKQMNIAGTPIQPDLHFPMVATRDIGAVASKHLLELDFKGNVTEYVLGARDYSYNEVTKIVGKKIGKPDLTYVQFPYDQAVSGMAASGFCSEDVAKQMVALSKAINEGKVKTTLPRNAQNTTPTTYEEFAESFAMAYQHS
jgi:uncharacterized protein YbjT (DUF2867 family)